MPENGISISLINISCLFILLKWLFALRVFYYGHLRIINEKDTP